MSAAVPNLLERDGQRLARFALLIDRGHVTLAVNSEASGNGGFTGPAITNLQSLRALIDGVPITATSRDLEEAS